ncbi:MAG: MBL fold metallo-hydrolase [Pseudomonadota bacterium]
MTDALGPDLIRVTAPNPSPLTGQGTNTYVLGQDRVVIVDPGPNMDRHLGAILQTVGERPVDHILLTHWHRDHSELAPRLSAAVDAPVLAFGHGTAGRSEIMQELARSGDIGGGEGADMTFRPDATLAGGSEIAHEGAPLIAHHTPGHFGGHLCFSWRDMLFSGDHVMGWSTTLISPPDGDLTDFMASCAALEQIPARVFYPGHGAEITAPGARIAELVTHRRAREAQICAALAGRPATVATLTELIYQDVSRTLWPAASRNVLAHLIDLTRRGCVTPKGPLTQGATFALT